MTVNDFAAMSPSTRRSTLSIEKPSVVGSSVPVTAPVRVNFFAAGAMHASTEPLTLTFEPAGA